jgi:hypothetical protein
VNFDICTSDDGNFFIPSPDGFIFDNNLNQIGTVPNNSFSFIPEMVFSADGKKLYVFPSFPASMQEFSFPGMSLENNTPLNYQVTRAFRDDNKMIVVGLVPVGFETKTIIDKLDL